MHAEVFSSARVRLMRPVRLVHPVRPTRSGTPSTSSRNHDVDGVLARAAQPAENS